MQRTCAPSALLCLLLLAGSADAQQTCPFGGLGNPNVLDVQAVIGCVLGLVPPSPACDPNGDGVADLFDILFLIRLSLGVEPCPEPPPLSDWEWQNPLPQGNDLRGVWSDGAVRIAVGSGGTILRDTGGGLVPDSSGVYQDL